MYILSKSAQKVYILRIYSIKHYFAKKEVLSYGYVWGNIWRDIEDDTGSLRQGDLKI